MADRKASQCDPEHINESKIDPEIYRKCKVSKEEWTAWLARQTP